MATPFPEIKPSGRSFKLGTFPVKVYRSMSGATVKRSFGNRASSYELQLEFQNITDARAADIVAHYTSNSGGFERFTLPAMLFVGMDSSLQGYIQAPTGIQWEYGAPPDVASVFPGISSVRVTLVGEQAI